jgi:hypothetical protein
LATTKKPHKVEPLRPHWRLVVRSGLQYAAVSDRYVAFLTGHGDGPVTLLDEQTSARTVMSPPDCSIENSNWATRDQPLFLNDRWLLVACGQIPPSDRETYDLYNIAARRWSAFPISTQCRGECQVVDIGAYWAKILTDEGSVMYGPQDYYLQNIITGQFEHDPATPGGTVFDDLSAPSGSSALCSPLRYPDVDNDAGHIPPTTWPPGPVRLYGQFALVFEQLENGEGAVGYHLRRCGSKLDMGLDFGRGASKPVGSPPVGSSRAVIQTLNGEVRGWFLPSLRPFTIPATLGDQIAPVGLGGRTIYVRTVDKKQLWAATLP